MKKYTLFIICLSFLISQGGHAQKKLGQTTLCVGGGLSLIGVASSLTTNGNNRNDVFRSTPVGLASFDVGLSELMSLGVSYSRQEFRYYYDGYDGLLNMNYWGRDKYLRENVALRTLFHFGKKEKLDMYAGVRLGFSFWSITTTNPDSQYKPENNKEAPWSLRVNLKNTHYSAQALYGLRYYFTNNIGFNFEVGIGPPCVLMIGLCARI